ncbi:hypothetical protein FAES_0315 [Fibrella aestuarina BUZ 2]|uniref:Type 1 periplasmic binding fold superfamily protein n=1 Tax=Fibrella aestuarina BUZ 2 TaxID=1166018 RepID=I0K2H6_9BACT|nr:hypothetical protein [Fibrella aestuarina]CCG98329.1 hypothetical protein FAES_0315 [Fibrella aestuarina BUZ 2]
MVSTYGNRLASLMGVLVIGGLLAGSCKKGTDPLPADENELITTVSLRFTQGSNTQTFIYQDKDGDGGAAPTKFDNVTLTANQSYTMTVDLVDESKTPAQSITDEIREKQDEHLFVFTPTPATLLTYTYADKDTRNFPIGLTGTVQTGAAGTGQLNVRLRHQPPINGAPVKNGTATPGSDDVNLNFNVTVR